MLRHRDRQACRNSDGKAAHFTPAAITYAVAVAVNMIGIVIAAVCTACAAFGTPVLRGGMIRPTAVAERMRAVVRRAI